MEQRRNWVEYRHEVKTARGKKSSLPSLVSLYLLHCLRTYTNSQIWLKHREKARMFRCYFLCCLPASSAYPLTPPPTANVSTVLHIMHK